MFKRANVVMLPTNEKASAGNIYRLPKMGLFNSIAANNHNNGNFNMEPQHLYITSNDEIKEGDWCLEVHNGKSTSSSIEKYTDSNDNTWWLRKANMNYSASDPECKKIIATTNISIKIKSEQAGDNTWYNPYPKPSDSFISKYIEEYNKGNVITDVMVEYEFQKLYKGRLDYNDMILNVECYNNDYNKIYKKSNLGRLHRGRIIERNTACNGSFLTENGERQFCTLKELYFLNLKVNSKDNTITIKKVKDSWSREEVEKLLLNISNDVFKQVEEFGGFRYSDWIKQNL